MTRSDFEMAYSLYSDIYKDVHNFRPRNHAKWVRLGLDALNAEIDSLAEELKEILEAEREAEENYSRYDASYEADLDYYYDLQELVWERQDEEERKENAEKALDHQWLQWEVLEMNLMGLRHR
tara:strand:- start:1841 stop:2209 length:369 start_codon:yes stop_codon:yes gene_type:complete